MADIPGTDEADILYGTEFDDMIDTKAGDDIIYGSSGLDKIDGGEGHDMVDYSTFTGEITVSLFDTGKSAVFVDGVAKDELYNVEAVMGGNKNDYIWGNSSNNTFHGNDGDDYFVGSLGRDIYYGDNGFDAVDYSHLNFGVYIDRIAHGEAAAFVYGEMVDRLYSVEEVIGTFSADIIKGGREANLFYGLGDEDMLFGRGGNDTLNGGMDDDVLTGGKGADVFEFRGEFDDDIVTDFKARGAKHDVIDLSTVDTISSYADLIDNHITQTADGLLIDAGDHGTILLEGMSFKKLSEDHFELWS